MHRVFFLLLLVVAPPAGAVGFQTVTAPDPGHAPIAAAIWYPSADPVSAEPLELFSQAVTPDGAMADGRHPLIVISHGQGGSMASHYDTAIGLAQAGYVVVALTHTGDNWHDQTAVMNPVDRARQVGRVLDYVLADWPTRASIDPERIGMFGFSIGGFTALVSLGGRPDFAQLPGYCGVRSTSYVCALVAAHTEAGVTQNVDGLQDERIKAAVVAAPALGFLFAPDGLRAVTMPMQLWRADADQILPAPDYADAVRAALPAPPEFHTVPNAGHFDFLAPCSAALADRVPMICQSAPGFDRSAFHDQFNAAVVAFFNRALPPP